MRVEKVLLAEPRGFCAGVEMAIKALAHLVQIFEPPVYCYHEIVHNKLVVDAFEAQGVIFVDDVSLVPAGAPLMLSAHGSAPAVEEEAGENSRIVIDAVCPLVTKVHHELRTRAAKGYTIIYVGHAGHEEAIGTMAVAPEAVHLVESPVDVARLPAIEGPVALLAQTTLSHDDWSEIAEKVRTRFPAAWLPARSDLCYATTNRQRALRAVAGQADAVVVIGSANSSNTRSLEKVAAACGAARVLRVDSPDELPDDLEGVVALTAGASAPESIVAPILARIRPDKGIETPHFTSELEYFPPPPELRELLRCLGLGLAVAFGAPEVGPAPTASDRQVRASDVLLASAPLAIP